MKSTEKINALQRANLEREKLLKECYQLLNKIAVHRYSLKLLIKAKNALSMIADYKQIRSKNASKLLQNTKIAID